MLPQDIEHPLTMTDFLNCCREVDGVKSTILILDVHLDVPNCGSARDVAAALQEQQVGSLPPPVEFKEAPPSDAKIGGIISENPDGNLDVVKMIMFKDKVPSRDALKLVSSSPYVPFSRPGPWAVKKAFQSLLDRIPGHHVQWSTVTKWVKPTKSSSSASSTWAPEKDELMEGIAFINDNAPESDHHNEQYSWILLNTKEDSETPGRPSAENKPLLLLVTTDLFFTLCCLLCQKVRKSSIFCCHTVLPLMLPHTLLPANLLCHNVRKGSMLLAVTSYCHHIF
jgi:hypothetical protein